MPGNSDKQLSALSLKLANSLRATIANFKIYPATSKIITESIKQSYELLGEIFKNNAEFTIAESQGKLLINGGEIAEPYLLQLLTQQQISSITLKKELTPAELLLLISELAKKEKKPKSSLKETLEEQKISSITVDQTMYVAITENQVVLEKLDSLFSQKQDLTAVLKNIRESYNLINSVTDPKDKQKLQERLAQHLATLAPELLKEIFEQQLPAEIENSGLKDQIMASLSHDKIKEIFSDIAHWYQEIKSESQSDFEVIEKLEQLKKFLNKVLLSPASRDIPFSLLEELLHTGLISEIPAWAKKDKQESLISLAEELLEKESTALLENPLRNNLANIIEQLCSAQLNELIFKLNEKIIENVNKTSGKIQLLAFQVLKNTFEVLNKYDQDLPIAKNEETIKINIELTGNIEIYEILLELLPKLAYRHLLKENYENTKQIIGILKKENLLYSDNEKGNIAKKSLRSMFENLTELLVDDFNSNNKNKEEGAAQIIYSIGNESPELFLKLIKESDSLRLHKRLAMFLKENKKAYSLIKRELALDNYNWAIARILDILPELGAENFLDELKEFIDFPDLAIKKKIVNLLQHSDSEQTKSLIINFLSDYDPKLKIEVVRSIGELKYSPATETLVALAGNVSPEIEEEICSTLGILATPQAGKGLIGILQGKKGFWGWSLPPESVRIRAVWSLRNFPSPDVEKVLLQAIKDKSTVVQKIAAESLKIIRGQPSYCAEGVKACHNGTIRG